MKPNMLDSQHETCTPAHRLTEQARREIEAPLGVGGVGRAAPLHLHPRACSGGGARQLRRRRQLKVVELREHEGAVSERACREPRKQRRLCDGTLSAWRAGQWA